MTQLEPFDEAKAITLRQAAARMSYRGRRMNLQTLQRFALIGCPTAAGKLKLPSKLIGTTRMLMPQWIEWWQAERNRLTQTSEQERPRTRRQASAGHNRAVRTIKKFGLSVG